MKKAILLAAWGAGNIRGQEGLQFFEKLCRARFPGWPVRWAFTSLLLRERMAAARKKSDSVSKALYRLHYERFDAVCLQPLQTIRGREYEDVCLAAEQAAHNCGLICQVGAPLLSSPEDAEKTALALVQHLPEARKRDEEIVFMGHGAKRPSSSLYENLGRAINHLDSHIFVGTMNGAVTIRNILPLLSSPKVWLIPLLSVVGQHALRDMAGQSPGSWRSQIEAQGHTCVPVLKGLTEYEKLAEIWLANLEKAAHNLSA